MLMTGDYPYIWWFRCSQLRPIDRKGQRCRVLVWARKKNSCLVEFPDGFKVVTSVNAIRKPKP